MNLDTIDKELLLARGQYSTVRACHEDCLKYLQVLTGKLSAAGSQILRAMQPADGEPGDIAILIADARQTTQEIEALATMINELAAQRAELRPRAWPKGK
jgi:hypothetical protein